MNVKLTTAITAFVIGVISFTAKSENSPVPVRIFKIQRTVPKQRIFTGEVAAAQSGDLSFQNKGRVTSVLGVGSFVRCLNWDKTKKVLKKGDIIATLDPYLYEGIVSSWKDSVQIAKNNLNEKTKDYERMSKLVKSHAVSKRDYDVSQAAYLSAKSTLDNAKGALLSAEYNVEVCNLRAPFTGQIEEVYAIPGSLVWEGDPIVKLTMMSPMKIRIKVGKILAESIGVQNAVKVYPSCSSKPVGARLLDTRNNEGIIEIIVHNNFVSKFSIPPAAKKLPKVERILFSIRLWPNDKTTPMCVPVRAIYKDESGNHFIYRAKGVKFMTATKGVPLQFQLEKIDIEPAKDIFIRFPEGVQFRLLKDSGKLEEFDVLLLDPPKGLKDGSMVCYDQRRWLFQPGEKVQVALASATQPGLYVPKDSIIMGPADNATVFMLENGMPRPYQVQITDMLGGFCRIQCEKLKPGMEIIIPPVNVIINEKTKVIKCEDNITNSPGTMEISGNKLYQQMLNVLQHRKFSQDDYNQAIRMLQHRRDQQK